MPDNMMERETVSKGKREAVKQSKDKQELYEPEIPMLDEMGFETYQFRCWRCARYDYREKNAAEAIQRGGHKLFCLPCDRPDLFEWSVETLFNGEKREFIRPLTHKEMHDRISDEARLLMAKQALVQNLRDRATKILKLTAELEVEYMNLQPAIEAAEKDAREAEILVSAMEKDDVGRKIENLEELNAKIKRLVAEIEEAKKNEGQGGTN